MNRREFLCAAASTAVAFGALGAAAPSPSFEAAGLIDVNVSLGRWSFRRLPLDEISKLVAALRRHGVTQAWAGSFEAAFGDDPATANVRLATDCRRHGKGLLLPFGSVNVSATDWEKEFVRCVEKHQMPGLRLFPGYHKYKLNDPAFARLLTMAAERKLVIQIATDLEDERTQPATARAPHVDAKPLLALLQEQPDARVLLLNWQRSVKPELVAQLAERGVGFDIATVENVGGVAELIGKISPGRVLFGSHAPFFYFESAALKLQESELSPAHLRAVSELNARRLLA